MEDAERRLTELDGIRGIAALGVVVFHFHKHLQAAPWVTVLFPVYRGGTFFVDLFFVLSGFILSHVYAYEARYATLRAALVSRLARLYPLHLLTLVLVAALQWVYVTQTKSWFVYYYNNWYHFVLNLFLLNQSGLQRTFSFNGPAWSVSTEFIVNVLFLVVALRSPRRAVGFGAVVVLGLILLDRTINWTAPAREVAPFRLLFHCFLGFGAGLVLRRLYERIVTVRMPGWAVETAFAAAIAAMLYFMSYPDRISSSYALTLAVFPAIIVLSLRSTVIGAALRARPIVHLGHVSFSVYMLHYPLELTYMTLFATIGRTPSFGSPLMLVLVVGVCIVASHFTWKYVEMPSRRWLKAVASGTT